MISWDSYQWIDSYVSLWGGIGGFVASEIKRRETKLQPPTARPRFTRWEKFSDCVWNVLLGVLLVHLYIGTGSKLNILSATITGGSATLIWKNLFTATPHQLPGTTEPAKVDPSGPEPPKAI
jgi:hypothetical protein